MFFYASGCPTPEAQSQSYLFVFKNGMGKMCRYPLAYTFAMGTFLGRGVLYLLPGWFSCIFHFKENHILQTGEPADSRILENICETSMATSMCLGASDAPWKLA